MNASKQEIFNQLQKDILPLQGYKPLRTADAMDIGLGPIKASFPNNRFPLGAIHEFISTNLGDSAATGGFVAGLLSGLMNTSGVSAWISSSRTIFPPALKNFGIDPDRILFIDVPKEKDVLWAMEEALKTNALAAVVGEMQEISFTASRRLQLAVEQSRVTGFILRTNPRSLATTACVSRWKIKSIPSEWDDGMPGVAFPRWNVELSKARNGRAGSWQIEWSGGRFVHPGRKLKAVPMELKMKTG